MYSAEFPVCLLHLLVYSVQYYDVGVIQEGEFGWFPFPPVLLLLYFIAQDINILLNLLPFYIVIPIITQIEWRIAIVSYYCKFLNWNWKYYRSIVGAWEKRLMNMLHTLFCRMYKTWKMTNTHTHTTWSDNMGASPPAVFFSKSITGSWI